MERKVGEIFEFGSEWYQCVEGNFCDDCAFAKEPCNNDPLFEAIGSCSYYRNDAASVVFKKLEKAGEPIEFARGLYFQRYQLADSTAFYEGDTRLFFNAPTNTFVYIEIKQTKEDMEEKKIKLRQDDIDWLKKQIRWAALPGYITHEEDYDRATEEIMNLFIPSDTEHSSSEKIGKNLKPFDLEAAKAGKPVCTRDGRKARIICFDRDWDMQIVALVSDPFGELVKYYWSNGKVDYDEQNDDDLIMLSEKKEGWVNIYALNTCYSSKEEAEANIDRDYEHEYVRTVKISWEE